MRYQMKILAGIPGKTDSRVAISPSGSNSGRAAALTSHLTHLPSWKTLPLLVLVLFCTSPSNATTFSEKSLGDLLAESDGIVLGTVRDSKCLYDRNKQIQTFVTLTDLRVIHGLYGGASLVLQLRGGKINGEIQ